MHSYSNRLVLFLFFPVRVFLWLLWLWLCVWKAMMMSYVLSEGCGFGTGLEGQLDFLWRAR